jgi:hypothetical protein
MVSAHRQIFRSAKMAPFVIREERLAIRRQQFARVTAGILGLAVLHIAGFAHGQAALRDQTSGLVANASGAQTWKDRFAGSFVDLSTYVGSGTFYTSGYHNPYVSNALFLRPTFSLGTPLRLSLNARVYLEQEYTTPDTPNGRSFYPSDSWLFLTAKNLYTMPAAKVRFSGTVRMILPTSYESRYAHLVTGLGISGGATRMFDLGAVGTTDKRWSLLVNLGTGFTKYVRTSEVRGDFAGDTSGCRAAGPPSGAGVGSASDSDRCGGPLNTSFAVTTSGMVALSRGPLALTVTLALFNEFKYAIAPSTEIQIYMATDQIVRGRNDMTWGIVSLGYEITPHATVAIGISSFQPALDSRYQNIRFPFFDFNGTNANNSTQAFVSLTGTL